MSTCRLYCPSIGSGVVALLDEEARHAVASRRLSIGDAVVLFDGAGGETDGTITRCDRRSVEVEPGAIRRYPFDIPRRITLAVAMPKQHRQGVLIEKCTELGVAAIWPILTEHGVTRPTASASQRGFRRAIEAAKQSGRRWVPEVASPMPYAESLDRAGAFDVPAIAQIDVSAATFRSLVDSHAADSSVIVWVGPEGGWSADESAMADAASITRVTLGPTVLRTETAAMAVCAIAASSGGESL